MSKSVKEWMNLLTESVSSDVEQLIEDPQVDEYYFFVSNAGVDLRGRIIAADGDDYTLEVNGEIYHVPYENIRQKSFAGEITESGRPGTSVLDEFSHNEYRYRICRIVFNSDNKIYATRVADKKPHLWSHGVLKKCLHDDGEWVMGIKSDLKSIKYFKSADEAKQYITGLTESVLTEALNTKQIIAALAMTLGLSTTAHAGLLSDMAASIEAAAPKVGATIVAKAKDAAAAAGEVYDEQSPKVIAAAKDAAQATKDAVAKYGPKIIDGAKSAGMTTADYVAKYYNEKSPEVIAGAKKLGVSTAEYIKMQTPEVIAAAKKAGVSTGDYLVAQYDDKSPAVKAAAKKAAKAAGDAVGDVADRSSRAAKEFVK